MEITLTDGAILVILAGVVRWGWLLQGKVNSLSEEKAILSERLESNNKADENREGNYREIISELKQILNRLGTLEGKVDLLFDRQKR